MRKTIAAIVALACAASLAPAAHAADVASPIRAVFLNEFSRTAYTMNPGQLLVFENDDPFLVHGIGGSLLAATADPGKTRLVRNSPYLTPGDYAFSDPLHPEMRATLTVSPTGTTPPPDAIPPTVKAKLPGVSARKLARSGTVRVRVTPSEAADVDVNLFIGRKKVATNSAAFADPIGRVIPLILSAGQRKQAKAGASLVAQVLVTDVTGKTASKRLSRNLASGGGKK